MRSEVESRPPPIVGITMRSNFVTYNVVMKGLASANMARTLRLSPSGAPVVEEIGDPRIPCKLGNLLICIKELIQKEQSHEGTPNLVHKKVMGHLGKVLKAFRKSRVNPPS